MRCHEISNRRPERFVSCRMGVEFLDYSEDLSQVIEAYKIGETTDFFVTPIASPRSTLHDANNSCDTELDRLDDIHLIPDLVLQPASWESQVALSINLSSIYPKDNEQAISMFEKLLKHALYLPSPVILINCPETTYDQTTVASVINKILRNSMSEKLILVRISLKNRQDSSSPPMSAQTSPSKKRSLMSQVDGDSIRTIERSLENQKLERGHEQSTSEFMDDNDSGMGVPSEVSGSQSLANASQELSQDDWNVWNSFRSHLEPDHRLGVCLFIDDDLETDNEYLARWTGEPVRMINLSADRFSSKGNFKNTMRPAGGIKEFMRMIALANSLKTSFVIQTKMGRDIREHLECLVNFCDVLHEDTKDNYRAWDDTLLSPLQPLSDNLDSTTYQVFENDLAKYNSYQRAMRKALSSLIRRRSSIGRTRFIVMVLGAGRGPLVDAMIIAIKKLNLLNAQFKIYALDKNCSSIESLKYKKVHSWDQNLPGIEVEVVAADMRTWEPSDTADIVATELLGSFSDNELSPECIDGTWRFTTKETISIPQSYSSYLAPICSYKMRQELHKSRFFVSKNNIYDQLQVVRLTNYYTISEPQQLFTFDHSDISRRPKEGANQREVTLKFHSKVDTVCHGFAGYFLADLYNGETISTIPSRKTPSMESWFPAYVPIDHPIQMPAGTCLEINFCRKESHEKVWYEWMIVKPERSRIHSQDGNGTAMSKII